MSNRQPFAAVVATKDRLSVSGSPDLLASLLPIHSPSSALPWVWPEGSSWQWHAGRPASWVVREIATGRPVLETYSLRVVERLNTAKYEAVTILSHLEGLNR